MLKWIVTFGIVILQLTEIKAQYKNVKIDEAPLPGKLTNPTIAISKRDATHMMATGFSDLVYASSDGGLTWTKTKMTGPEMASDDRVLLSDSKGTMLSFQSVASTDGKATRQLFSSQSKDLGQTWDTPVAIAIDAEKYQAAPAATLDTKGNIIVAWTQFDKFPDPDSTCHSLVYLSSSSSGKKWSKPVVISQQAGDCLNDDKVVTGAVPAVGPDGKMFVAWYSEGKILMDRSFGSGTWLQNDIVVRSQRSIFNLMVPGHTETTSLPQICIDQTKGTYHGCIYVSWADVSKGATDSEVWFMRSNNHGDNWSTPLRMGNATPTKHQYAPRMTIDQVSGYIYILYYDRGENNEGQTDVYLSYSSDSGANFKAVKISESSFTPDDQSVMGSYLNISAHGGRITPIWSRMDSGVTSLMTASIKQEDLVKPPESKSKKKK